MKKLALTALLLGVMTLTSTTASASLLISGSKAGFSATLMDSFDVQGSLGGSYIVNNPGSPFTDSEDAVTLNPTYSDGTGGMTGAAGATGSWDAAAGTDVEVLLGDAFGSTDLSGYLAGVTEIRMVAYNDNNNDTWNHGLWIATLTDGIVKTVATEIDAGSFATLSLDLTGVDLTTVIGYGVFVGNDSVPGGDSFHSSWSIPEPASVICWSLMAGIGGIGFSRKRRNKKA